MRTYLSGAMYDCIYFVLKFDDKCSIAEQHWLTKPTKIDPNLLSEVFSHVIKWLVFEPLSPSGPVFFQHLLFHKHTKNLFCLFLNVALGQDNKVVFCSFSQTRFEMMK